MKTFLNQLAQDPKNCLINNIRERNFAPAYLGYTFGVISLYFAIKLSSFEQASLGAFFATFILWFIFDIIFNFILAAIANIFLEFVGYKNTSASGLFILLGISQLILTLLIPWFLIRQAFPQVASLTPLLIIAIILAQISFVLSSMKKVFELPKGVSFLVFMLSFAMPFLAGITSIIFLISFISTLVG